MIVPPKKLMVPMAVRASTRRRPHRDSKPDDGANNPEEYQKRQRRSHKPLPFSAVSPVRLRWDARVVWGEILSLGQISRKQEPCRQDLQWRYTR